MTDTIETETFEERFAPLLKRAPRTYLTIVLEKVVEDGKVAKGETYRWTYKSLMPSEALQRASKALQRDHKGENPLNWRQVK